MITNVEELLTELYKKGKRKDIVKIDHTAYVQEAATKMKNEGINLIAVTKNGKYVGVISTSDTSGEFASTPSALRPSERRAFDVMTRDVVTVSMGAKLMDIPKEFKQLHQIRHLVVVDKRGRWKAILDTNEVLEAVMANIDEDERLLAYHNGEFRRRD